MAFSVRTHYQDSEIAENSDRERFSSFPSRVFQWAERRGLDRVIRLLSPGTRVLDAPCGTGRLMDVFLRRGLAVIGADISAEMMAVARRRTTQWDGRVSFSRMDFSHMPLADRSIVATFSLRFLLHILSGERVVMLREFRRVSQYWVAVSLGISTPWHRFRRHLKAWLGHPGPVRYPVTNRKMAEDFRQAGLREVRRYWTARLLSEQILVACERI